LNAKEATALNRDDVEKVKERIDIVDIVGEYLPLRKTGKNFRGLCPFHSEKTPSFYVSPDRQTYHCFGCGKGGDVFSFVMEKEGLSFPEALRMLAERAGVVLEQRNEPDRDRGLAGIMEEALAFYIESLRGPKGEVARKYLQRRGLTAGDARRFELGWAPSQWDALGRRLRENGVNDRDAVDAGLLIEGQRGCYDRFRGRVIFPIRDIRGRLTAFGGRLVDGDGAKYINSPESELYSKRSGLYLLNQAKGAIRERGRTILVEGYMDALRLHMNDFTEAVASLGTSLTGDQAALLKRFSDRCFICYDPDTAGRDAAIRGMYVLQEAGLDIRVVVLPSGKDPDDLLSETGGRGTFDSLLDRAMPLVLYHIAARREQLSGDATKSAAVREIVDGMARLDPIDVSRYLPPAAAALGLLPTELSGVLSESRKKLRSGEKKKEEKTDHLRVIDSRGENTSGSDEPRPDPWESALCYLLWSSEKRRNSAATGNLLPLLTDERIQAVAAALVCGESPEDLRERWAEMGDSFPMTVIATGGAQCETGGDDPWSTVLGALRKRKITGRFLELKEKYAKGEASPAQMREYTELSRKLKAKGGNDVK